MPSRIAATTSRRFLSIRTPSTARETPIPASASSVTIGKLRPASRSIAFIAASSLAGGLSLALYNTSAGLRLREQLSQSNLTILGNSFSGSSSRSSSTMAQDYPVHKSDEEWRVQLSPEQFRVLRKKGTEMAGTGEYDKHAPKQGVYNCAGCDTPLYKYDSKFSSGCGWPAFFEEIPGTVVRHTDSTFGMKRTEIVCANCGGHLGHVFKGEGFGHPKDERHCVNSVSLKYSPDEPARK